MWQYAPTHIGPNAAVLLSTRTLVHGSLENPAFCKTSDANQFERLANLKRIIAKMKGLRQCEYGSPRRIVNAR